MRWTWRIKGVIESDHPLDLSAVHPEAHPLAERILADDLPSTPKMAKVTVSARARQDQQTRLEATGAMASAFARLKR